jgi:hypothetical protein
LIAVIEKLVISAISKATSYAAQDFFQRRRVERAVETAAANVAETLVSFFASERVTEDLQYLLLEECRLALQPVVEDPSALFVGSLNGQRIFDDMFARGSIPSSVSEPGARALFEMVFVRIASVLCLVPAAVRDWEANAWKENYRRLDAMVAELKSVFDRVDAINTRLAGDVGSNVATLCKYLAQREAVEIDITGLRSDHAVHKTMEEMFVHPELSRSWDDRHAHFVEMLAMDNEYVTAFVSRGYRAVVYGAPGSGKSTWSRWLHRLALSELWDGLVIRIELKGIDFDQAPSVLALLRGAVGINFAEVVDADFLTGLVNSAKLALILDGFDEIGAAKRERALAWVHEVEAFLQKCSITITSRPLATDHLARLGKHWLKWVVEPFDVDRIVEYITKWYSTTELVDGTVAPDAVQLAEQWRGDNTISPLTGNPLLLSTLLMVHHLDGNLPNGRAELDDRYIRGMLGVWDDRRKIEQPTKIDLESKRAILTDLAVEMLERGSDQLEEAEAIAVVREALLRLGESENEARVLEGIRERSGLLVGPGVYSFSHKTIGEFLVAQAVVQGDREMPDGSRLDAFKLFDQRQKDEWNTVLFLWAGLAPVATLEQFIRKCAEASDGPAAFGLLLDQYYRILPPLRSKLVASLRGCLNTITYDRPLSYAVGGLARKRPAFTDKAMIGMLTGLASHPNASIKTIARSQGRLRTLIEKLIDDGLIAADDLRGLDATAKELVWMLAVRKAPSRAVFRKALGNIPYQRNQRRRRLFWLLESEVTRSWGPSSTLNKGMVPADIIQEVVSFDRAIAPAVPLAIMSAAVRRAFTRLPLAPLDASARRQRIAQDSSRLLVLPGNGDMTGEYLVATSYWRFGAISPVAEEFENDLLASYRSILEEQRSLGHADEAILSAIELVDALLVRRATPSPTAGEVESSM